jgi:hypothetical protein
MPRKYNQRVHGRMRRFSNGVLDYHKDNEGICYMVRDNTYIQFGEGTQVICSVLMTNPGSYGFIEHPHWSTFESGGGFNELGDTITHWGFPDPTMINLIKSLEIALGNVNNLNGKVKIFNTSNAVCPKGNKAELYHQNIKAIIEKQNESFIGFLEDENVYSDKILRIFEESPFVIMGFLREKFSSQVDEIMRKSSINNYKDKIVISLENNWPSHPINWIRKKNLGEAATNRIKQILNRNS